MLTFIEQPEKAETRLVRREITRCLTNTKEDMTLALLDDRTIISEPPKGKSVAFVIGVADATVYTAKQFGHLIYAHERLRDLAKSKGLSKPNTVLDGMPRFQIKLGARRKRAMLFHGRFKDLDAFKAAYAEASLASDKIYANAIIGGKRYMQHVLVQAVGMGEKEINTSLLAEYSDMPYMHLARALACDSAWICEEADDPCVYPVFRNVCQLGDIPILSKSAFDGAPSKHGFDLLNKLLHSGF